jgi:hypothetical protein
MDNVQNCDTYINIPASQTYRPYSTRYGKAMILGVWSYRPTILNVQLNSTSLHRTTLSRTAQQHFTAQNNCVPYSSTALHCTEQLCPIQLNSTSLLRTTVPHTAQQHFTAQNNWVPYSSTALHCSEQLCPIQLNSTSLLRTTVPHTAQQHFTAQNNWVPYSSTETRLNKCAGGWHKRASAAIRTLLWVPMLSTILRCGLVYALKWANLQSKGRPLFHNQFWVGTGLTKHAFIFNTDLLGFMVV